MKALLATILLFLSGCATTSHVITCDSGFTTGISERAHRINGTIHWVKYGDDYASTRRMIDGEVCDHKVLND